MTNTDTRPGLSGFDIALIALFLAGIYSHYTIQITASIPFPAAPSGIAGLALLWRRRGDISAGAFTGFLVVILLFVLSILCATDLSFLGRRFNGLIQLTYSLVIGFAFYQTLILGTREQVARLFLALSLIILIGCVLEQYGGLRPLSDAVRTKIYSSGLYESDVRDQLLYGHVRPKFFASEPSIVSLCFVIFAFAWMVCSRWRWKIPFYVAMVGAGYLAITGPTLLLMLMLLIPYQLSIVGNSGGGAISSANILRAAKVIIIGLILCGVALIAAQALFANRFNQITSGSDPSFFYRVLGPFLAAKKVIETYPIAGAGLTGEPFIEDDVVSMYISSPSFSRSWRIAFPATELIVNYFWLHWIYLGLVWGITMIVAISAWLRAAGVRHILFCWIVWAILGQASGAYVGPMTWAIFFLAAAVARLTEQSAAAPGSVPASVARMPNVRWRAMPPRMVR